jgi:hypothetical protein
MTARGAFLDAREGGFDAFHLEARTLHVQRYEVQYQVVRLPVGEYNRIAEWRVYNYTLHDAVVTLTEGDHHGWLGLYFPLSGGRLATAATGLGSVEGKTGISLGEGVSGHNEAVEGPVPYTQGYDWTSTDPLLLVETQGELRQTGSGQMKLQGPDLSFAARENATAITYETGSEASVQGPVGTRFSRWFFLSYEEADLTIGNPERSRLAASATTASWSGAAAFRPVEGSMRGEDATYSATGRQAHVVGDLVATVAPVARGGEVRLRLDLTGDLTGTTLQRQQGGGTAALGARPSAWPLVAGALALALASVLLVGVLRRGRKEPPPMAAEDRLALARIEAGRERYQEAVTHVREARAEAPTSVRLLLEEASYLGAMGRLEEALRHYAEAAVLILQSGADPERAEALLVKALARSPILVLDALYDVSGTFDALRGRPTFEAAVGEAQRAMGEA